MMTSNGFSSADIQRESVEKQQQRVDMDALNRELDDARELLGKQDRL